MLKKYLGCILFIALLSAQPIYALTNSSNETESVEKMNAVEPKNEAKLVDEDGTEFKADYQDTNYLSNH